MNSPFEESVTAELFEKAYTKALKFLTIRPRSKKEVTDYLKKKGFETIIIEKVLELLEKQKFLNDTEFVKWWIEQRQTFKQKGKFVIKQELLVKGIDKDIIESTLNESPDDSEIAQVFFEKHRKKFDKYKGLEFKKKVYDFLSRRGYSWDIIEKIIDKYR